MIQYTVNVDTKQFDGLKRFAEQARVPTAKALTFTAKDAQLALKAELPAHFVLRRNWVPSGIRITPANGGNLTAQVGSIDKYMERHVVGAGKEKVPDQPLAVRSKRDNRGRLASGGILVESYGSIGSAKTHTVVRRKLKRIDSQKRKTFHIFTGGVVLLARRKTKARLPLEILATLHGRVEIEENWDMLKTVTATVNARFAPHFYRAMARAAP